MNKDELLNRLSDIEWEYFEIKNAYDELPKNIWETVSAFANISGGWIVFGVSQNGKKFEITGLTNPEKTEQDFTTVLRSQNKFNVLITPISKKDISMPRNPVLAKLFRCAKLADNAGYGFDKMLKWEKSTNTKVYFENSIDIALVVFSFSDMVEKLTEKTTENSQNKPEYQQITDNKQPNKTAEKGQINKQKAVRKTSRKQQRHSKKIESKIIELLRSNSNTTRKNISIEIKLSDGGVSYYLKKLKKEGHIKRIGGTRGSWIIIEP